MKTQKFHDVETNIIYPLKVEKFFCLSSDGLIYFLGLFDKLEDAELAAEQRKIDCIWLFGEDSAKSWKDTLEENISW